MELLNFIGSFLNIFSIIILLFGISIFFYSKKFPIRNWLLAYLISLLSLESLAIFIGLYIKSNVFFIFILSFFVQFLFLTHFYWSIVFKLSKTKRNTLLCLGLIPFVIHVLPDPYYSFLQYYDRTPYSFAIMLYSIRYFYALVNGSITLIHARNLLNAAILLFFTVDLFLALGTKYLITESLLLVSWFWSFRAILLQVFYITLIYYGWKSSRIP